MQDNMTSIQAIAGAIEYDVYSTRKTETMSTGLANIVKDGSLDAKIAHLVKESIKSVAIKSKHLKTFKVDGAAKGMSEKIDIADISKAKAKIAENNKFKKIGDKKI
jgi:hypothetical protein